MLVHTLMGMCLHLRYSIANKIFRTNNTVQDGPDLTIPTTRRLPTSATGFYGAKRAEQEYQIFLGN